MPAEKYFKTTTIDFWFYTDIVYGKKEMLQP